MLSCMLNNFIYNISFSFSNKDKSNHRVLLHCGYRRIYKYGVSAHNYCIIKNIFVEKYGSKYINVVFEMKKQVQKYSFFILEQ